MPTDPTSTHLPSVKEAMEQEMPKDYWLRAMGENHWDKEQGKNLTSKLHIIGRDGRLVCKCEVNPRSHAVYSLDNIGVWRTLFCVESVTYFRGLVRDHLQQRNRQGEDAEGV